MSQSLRYTYDFVRRSLADDFRTVLEIGCGDGRLARRLENDGLAIVAIDSDPEAVRLARAEGVDAREMKWPGRIDQTFDAILFTRSLHHVHALEEAIDAALSALNPGGLIIVEDFRAEGGSERSAIWFSRLVDALADEGQITQSARAEALEQAAPSRSHDHQLHASTEIARALGRSAALRECDAAYYFRYLEPHLRDRTVAEQILELELDLIEHGKIDGLGKRFVVTRL